MLKDLERIVDECDASEGDGERLEIELRQAAQNLWRGQFLYRSDFGCVSEFREPEQQTPAHKAAGEAGAYTWRLGPASG